MSNRWYVTTNGKQRSGPLSDRQLKDLAASGQLLPTDMVLLDGRSSWVAASTINGLFVPLGKPVPAADKYPIAIPVAPPPQLPGPANPPLNSPNPAHPTHRSLAVKYRVLGIVCLAILGFVLLAVGGVAFVFFFKSSDSPNLKTVEHRASARGKEEELVRKYILDTAHDPNSVEFDRWGPHDLTAELGVTGIVGFCAALDPGTRPISFPKSGMKETRPDKVIRVCFREKNALGAKQFKDALFLIQDEKVVEAGVNQFGDDWHELWRQLLLEGKGVHFGPGGIEVKIDRN